MIIITIKVDLFVIVFILIGIVRIGHCEFFQGIMVLKVIVGKFMI